MAGHDAHCRSDGTPVLQGNIQGIGKCIRLLRTIVAGCCNIGQRVDCVQGENPVAKEMHASTMPDCLKVIFEACLRLPDDERPGIQEVLDRLKQVQNALNGDSGSDIDDLASLLAQLLRS